MSTSSEICILIPTTSRYRNIAEFTVDRIGRLWNNSPRTYLCGISGHESKSWLPLLDDAQDWVGIVLTAARQLRMQYRFCYLILDDHPPLWRCNDPFLNDHLPGMMNRLNAAYIGLDGWGPGRETRKPTGIILSRSDYFMERVSADFRWKFSLHPALWRLDALIELLEVFTRDSSPRARTPWYFERNAGGFDESNFVSNGWGVYRVCGRATTACKSRYRIARIIRFAVRAGGYCLRNAGLPQVSERIAHIGDVLDQYYEGPYPLFWSGVMKKGHVNEDLLVYLNIHGKKRYECALIRALPGMSVDSARRP